MDASVQWIQNPKPILDPVQAKLQRQDSGHRRQASPGCSISERAPRYAGLTFFAAPATLSGAEESRLQVPINQFLRNQQTRPFGLVRRELR